ELVLACAPKPAENAVPAQGRPGRTARSGSRDIANDRRLAAWPACASDADDGVAFRHPHRHVWLVDAMSPEYLHIEPSSRDTRTTVFDAETRSCQPLTKGVLPMK